jgi:hypothetical protein
MTLVRNPFDAGGYSLAEMTQAINILPNLYTRLGQIGLFRFEGVSQRSVIIEQFEGVLNLLPSVPLGGPATVDTRESRSMRSFALPWIPHDDAILPGDIQGQPALGVFDGADPLVEVMNRKLQLMRRKHAQTREYMEMNALRGIVKDGAGTTLYNYFTEFGLAQISVDFLLGTAGTNVQGKVREVLRSMEDNLLGESMTDVHALVSREFFDKLIAHPKTEEAYKFYAATGAQPLRQDVRRNFPLTSYLRTSPVLGGSVRTGIGQSPWFWGGEGGSGAGSALGVGRSLPGGSNDRAVFCGGCGRGGGDDARRIAAGGEIGEHAGAQGFGFEPLGDGVGGVDGHAKARCLRTDLRHLGGFGANGVGGHCGCVGRRHCGCGGRRGRRRYD